MERYPSILKNNPYFAYEWKIEYFYVFLMMQVKLWKTRNCFSFHTFSGHTSIVTGVTFMQNNRAILSSSLDGTVRAWDVKR